MNADPQPCFPFFACEIKREKLPRAQRRSCSVHRFWEEVRNTQDSSLPWLGTSSTLLYLPPALVVKHTNQLARYHPHLCEISFGVFSSYSNSSRKRRGAVSGTAPVPVQLCLIYFFASLYPFATDYWITLLLSRQCTFTVQSIFLFHLALMLL